MRRLKLILTCLLFILGPCSAFPAWLYDGTDYVSVADGAATTLPNGDWAIGGWIKLDTTSGWPNDYTVVSAGVDGGSEGEFTLGIDQDGGSSTRVEMYIADDFYGSEASLSSTGDEFAGNTNPTHVLLQRSGSNFQFYIGGVASGTVAVGGIDELNFSTALIFGPYYNEIGNWNALPGSLASWAKWNRALTQAEITSLAQGFSPSCVPGSQMLDIPMIGAYQERRSGLAVTNSGTTVGAHPRMYFCGE
ncbi:MAG: LamG domain-containing protein [Candidatus Dadabacteria bacterium]